MATPLQGTYSASGAIQRVHYTHDAMIDLLLAHPGITQEKIGEYFGYTAAWVSRIINSDAFQARLADRKETVIDPAIRQNFEERLKGAANTSLDIVMKKLDMGFAAPSQATVDLAVKTLDLTTKALGFGARTGNIGVQQNFVVALPQQAASDAEWAQRQANRPGLSAGSLSSNTEIVTDVEARDASS